MRVLVTGAAGMLGRKLTARIVADGGIGGRAVSALHLTDIVCPEQSAAGFTIETSAGDFSVPGAAERLVGFRPDLVFHLAAIVSGEAERDLDKGLRINLDGTRALFDALRVTGSHPRVVFASSIAVFGGPYPDIIPDDFHTVPLTSYGMEKLSGEALLSDYSRRELIDGVALRLPTVCVRPGKPNAAASGFFSSIIREPLIGETAYLPVPRDVVHTHASPRAAVGFLVHAAAMETATLGARRAITLPGVGVTVGEQIEALRAIAGDAATSRIVERPDELVARIVSGWPTRFAARRARDLGFAAETGFDEIIRIHIADELGGTIPA